MIIKKNIIIKILGLEDIIVMAKGEIGFSKFIVMPLFSALNNYLNNNL